MTIQRLSTQQLKNLHEESFANKERLSKTSVAGCFNCLRVMPVSAIEEYCDDDTAVCPHCGIDSLLGETDPDTLAQMKAYAFKRAE